MPCSALVLKVAMEYSLQDSFEDWGQAAIHSHRAGIHAHQRYFAILGDHVKRHNGHIKSLPGKHDAMHDLHTGTPMSVPHFVYGWLKQHQQLQSAHL